MRPITDWLPITKDELLKRGLSEVDIVLVTGDAYVDHPSFGAAVIGRVLEHEGYKVVILPQPNWKDDLRDFKKFGQPRLFFGVTAGCMDSMVNHYTAAKRLRSDDAYTPNDQAGFRPDYPTVVYTKILKQLYPSTPVVLGGIEASLRRFAHYDYWQDKLMPSILIQSGADLLVYGMGEKPIVEIARQLNSGKSIAEIRNVLQTGFVTNIGEDVHVEAGFAHPNDNQDPQTAPLQLFSYDDCLSDKKKSAQNFQIIETESNKTSSKQIIQNHGDKTAVINPPYPQMAEVEIDTVYDLPYTRQPHPKYNKRGVIPAYEMIKHSVNIHRGCFGGCAFCTISAHQGKHIVSRSKNSILKEIENIVRMDDFKGHISDLGGPSANMWQMKGKTQAICEKCSKYSCIHPTICQNLNIDHKPLIDLYKSVSNHSRIKKVFIGSGIRYDLFDKKSSNPDADYAEYMIKNCVSGRLKVAPEHTEPHVLQAMRKPTFDRFVDFKIFFDDVNRRLGLRQQLIPYFISSHPSCTEKDMKLLAEKTKKLGYRLEAVQDFTPTPMTLATEMYYTGYDPYTMKKIYCAKTSEEKRRQNQVFFEWKQPRTSHPIPSTKTKNK
ncbi:MAG: YgiQ family radical SAM protein [Bacteroidales bacterium]|nr:YgiQ family radical SAM protein [Bacteroidales bacterium]